MTLIVGPSGCGKTTLLSVVAGILDADDGEVIIFGSDITAMSDRRKTKFRAQSIGFVFQQYNLLPALTAAENAAIPLVIAGWSRAPAVRRASEVLASIGMGKKVASLPTQLSGGQMQRVAIARALVNSPGVLLADEPTGNLDNTTGAKILELLLRLTRQQKTVTLLATHSAEAAAIADIVVTLRDGSIVSVDRK
jgi:putative ABC transport system ATP-binding protein